MKNSIYNKVFTGTFCEFEKFKSEFTTEYKHGYLLLRMDAFNLQLSHYNKLSYCLEDISHAIDGLENRLYHIAVYKLCEKDGNVNVTRAFYLEDEILKFLNENVNEHGVEALKKFCSNLENTYLKDLTKIKEKYRYCIA